MSIHPTAIVSPQAELGADVDIGPYCIISGGVRLGDGCRLASHVNIEGPSVIGSGNLFLTYSVRKLCTGSYK